MLEQTAGATTVFALHCNGGSVAVSEPRRGLTRRQTLRELFAEEASIERVLRCDLRIEFIENGEPRTDESND